MITLQGKTPLSTATVTDTGSRGEGNGLIHSVSVGMCSALVALIVAAVIITSVTMCLIRRKKRKYRINDGRNNSELRGSDCCSIKYKEDTTYDHGNANYSIAPKRDTYDTYDHLPPAPPAIHDYASVAIKSDDDIITTPNEAYAINSTSVSTNSAY